MYAVVKTGTTDPLATFPTKKEAASHSATLNCEGWNTEIIHWNEPKT